jgi:hypothetical protein
MRQLAPALRLIADGRGRRVERPPTVRPSRRRMPVMVAIGMSHRRAIAGELIRHRRPPPSRVPADVELGRDLPDRSLALEQMAGDHTSTPGRRARLLVDAHPGPPARWLMAGNHQRPGPAPNDHTVRQREPAADPSGACARPGPRRGPTARPTLDPLLAAPRRDAVPARHGASSRSRSGSRRSSPPDAVDRSAAIGPAGPAGASTGWCTGRRTKPPADETLRRAPGGSGQARSGWRLERISPGRTTRSRPPHRAR